MKFQKLLAGVAAAALLTSPAMAFDVILGDANGTLNSSGTAYTDPITEEIAVAEEAVFDFGARDGLFELTIRTEPGGRFAEDENYIILVELIGGTYAEDVTGDAVTDGAGGEATVGGTTIRFDGADPTGEAGETTVGFLTNVAAPGRQIGLELPIRLDGCNDLDIVVSIQTGGGAAAEPLEQGTFRLEDAAICINAFKALVTDDRDYQTTESYDSFLTSASEFSRFRAGVATAFGGDDDEEDRATIGVATVTFNPESTTRPILTDLEAFSDALDGSEVERLGFDVVLDDDTGVASAYVLDAVDEAADGTGDTELFVDDRARLILDDLDASDTGVANADTNINALVGVNLTAGALQVENQTPRATNVALTFEPGEGLEERDTDEMGMNLDDLNFEGVRCGEFDWVGDANRPTQNIWRATGYGDDVITVFASVRNAVDGLGPRTEELTTVTIGDEETVITATDLTAAFGNFIRGDFTFNFIGAEGPFSLPDDTEGPNLSVGGLDCDRLQASPVTRIVTPFGNSSSPQNTAIDGYVNDGDDNTGFFFFE